MELKPNMKSDFDEFLEADGILADAEATAIKRVIAYQIEQEMKAQNITKTKMAELMHTSRAVVNRLLNPKSSSLTLNTLESATHALGKQLNISIV
jgi:antitoxin HicB